MWQCPVHGLCEFIDFTTTLDLICSVCSTGYLFVAGRLNCIIVADDRAAEPRSATNVLPDTTMKLQMQMPVKIYFL